MASRKRQARVTLAVLASMVMAAAAVLITVPTEVWAAASSVTVVGSATTVRPDLPTPTDGAVNPPTPYKLTAAKNEFESFQVVIEAGDQDINELRVDPGQQLVQVDANGTVVPGGASIANTNVTIYREGNYKVNAGFASDGEGGTGLWPDALIPEKTADGQNRNAFPFKVAAGEKVVVWVDVLVPKTASPGDYAGTVVVSAASGLPTTSVPIDLEVLSLDRLRDGALPSTPSLTTVFDLNTNNPCAVHGCASDDERWELLSKYVRVALDNRIGIAKPYAGAPWGGGTARFRQYMRPLIMGTDASTRLPGARVEQVFLYDFFCGYSQKRDQNGVPTETEEQALQRYRICMESNKTDIQAETQAWKTEAEGDPASGRPSFANRVYLYARDEPGQDPNKWEELRTNAAYYREVWPSLRVATTATVQNANNPNIGGTLNGQPVSKAIDTFIPLVNHMEDKVGNYAGNQRNSYEAWESIVDANEQESDNRVWMYNSCMSFSCDGTTSAYWNGWPGYAIDQPATQSRAMGWLSFTYGTSGEYYFETVGKLGTAWNDGGQYSEGGNGDGTLFYPGTPARIGGTTHVPVESIRLKRIRDGREDYEYLKYLADNGKKADAESVAKGLFPVMYETTATQTELDDARGQLIAGIKNLNTPGGDVELTSIADSPDPVNAGSNLTYTIKVTNTSANYMAESVKVSDVLPAGVDFVSASAGCAFNGATRTVGCDVGQITGGGGFNYREIVVRPTASGTLTNTATVSSSNDPNSANNSKSVQTQVNGGGGATCQGSAPTPGIVTNGKNITGTPGDDVVLGTSGDDNIFGLGGNDKICGGGGFDTLSGGPGDDALDGGNSPGGDALEYGRQSSGGDAVSGGVTVDLPNREAKGSGIGTDTLLSGFTEIYGSVQADIIIGDGAANHLYGIGGDDLLMGGGDDDAIDGGADRDTVSYKDARAGVSVSLTQGEAFGRLDVGGDAGIGQDSLIGATVEDVEGSAYGDQIAGNAVANITLGLGGADTINGEGAGDTARGGEGNDRLIGTSGVAVDRLYGEGGDDRLDARDNRPNDVLNGGTHARGDGCRGDRGDVRRSCNP